MVVRGRDPDRGHSPTDLAAGHNFNPGYAEEALRSAQSTSECAWTLWPAGPALGSQGQRFVGLENITLFGFVLPKLAIKSAVARSIFSIEDGAVLTVGRLWSEITYRLIAPAVGRVRAS
jgi:hypothetical protein